MFGYLLVPDNRYEKFFVLCDSVGRAGKGTAMQVLTWLLSEANIGATTFQGFAKDFGLASLAERTVCLFNEANAQHSKDVPPLAIDRLKAITGNDAIEIEQKNRDSIYMKMPTRFVISCNRVPKFRDPSGALMKRMHLLEFKQTFDGREVTNLKDVDGPLYKELSGILNWALAGLQMLHLEDKRFIAPAASKEVLSQMERSMAPVKAFFDDCVQYHPKNGKDGVEKEQLFAVYRRWANDKEGMAFIMGREGFFTELRHLAPLRVERRARNGESGRKRFWFGLSLTEEGKEFNDGLTDDEL